MELGGLGNLGGPFLHPGWTLINSDSAFWRSLEAARQDGIPGSEAHAFRPWPSAW